MANATHTGQLVRAQSLDDYIGQGNLKRRLRVHIEAAIAEERELDHMLFVAPPGSGKTTLAGLIARELKDPFHTIRMPVKEKDFLYFCMEWQGGILLLDEIHMAPKAFQLLLYNAIEDGFIQAQSGRQIDVRHITFIAATTEPQGVERPLWDRFLVKPEWEEYTDQEMGQIVAGMARRAGVSMPAAVAEGLSRAAGGTPRIAGQLVVACRALMATGVTPTVAAILDLAELDIDGLSSRHLSYLRCLDELGGVAGLSTLCSMLQLSQPVIEGIERLLIARGFLRKDPSGRMITQQGRAKVPDRSSKRSAQGRRRAS
jgi:holliday junction DNA helicase RuvB